MKRVFETIAVFGVLLAMTGASYGQGGTTATLSGIAVDSSGGVIPGADITAKHSGTGVTTSVVSNTEGVFVFPALNPGTYTVTASLQGFKTYIASNVVLTSGAGATVRAVLEVGAVEESITVSSSSEIIQTQNSTISTTINTKQITQLPLTTRSAMDFVTMLPGVATPNGNRNSTINGLPRGTINITLDGVNIQDNTLRSSDGFFAIVSPRIDAVEEVTLQTAAQGADSGGQGAVQVKFVTRGGTNEYVGSAYYFYRNDGLNANTWFNNRDANAKPVLLQNQIGVRFGGPIKQNKMFFFVNYEEFRQPSDTSRQRTLLNPTAQGGTYTYTSGGVTRTVNVLQLAATNGFTSSVDPTISKVLADIRNSTTLAGGLKTNDANTDFLTFNNHVDTVNRFPTVRVDLNLNNNHRFSSAFNYQHYYSYPDTLNSRDPNFPGFPAAAGQASTRLGFSNWLRSTFSSTLVNEARVGYSGAPVEFFPEYDLSMFSGSIANTNGTLLSFPSVGATLTNPAAAAVPQSRNATAVLLEDNVTLLKGAHTFTMGASATQYTIWMKNQTLIPTANLGFVGSDPSLAMFSAANFPGASTTQLTAAENLYSLLTGRISSFTGEARIDETTSQYTYLGASMQRARMRETDMFIQDQWRLRSNLTVNAGLRYGLQLPFAPLNDSYTYAGPSEICGVSGVAADGTCNLFKPGVVAPKTTLPQYTAGTQAYHVDKNNLAPSVGAVWTPEKREGWLGRLMGQDGDFVVRGGYSRNYSRPGLSDFSTPFSSNTGLTQSLTRTPTSFMLFRDPTSTAPIGFNASPAYPLTPSLTSSVNGFFQDIQVTSADSVSVGIQRALNRNTSVEVRYVGSWSHDVWQTQNYNEFNVFDNGFIGEFRKAQANLQANIAGGKGSTFAYTGIPGTSPLPIFLAYFNGVNAASAGDATKYAGTNWTSSTNLGFLAAFNPNPFAFACLSTACNNTTRQNGFIGNTTFRNNAAAAGLPSNFFIVNPDALAGANVTNSLGTTRYNALQLEVRRRFAQGFQLQTSYVFGHQYSSNLLTLRAPEVDLRNTGDPGDITHTFKLNAVYDLPFGSGHSIGGGSNSVVSRIVSGWQVGVAQIVRSGQLVDFGNVRLVGMTADDLSKAFELRFDDAGRHVYMLPQDIIDNTIAAFNVSATSPTGYGGTPPTGRYMAPANGPDCIELDSAAAYGNCAARTLVVTGPVFRQTDLRATKQTRISGSMNFEFGLNILNLFNQPNFVPRGGVGGTNVLTNYEVTGLSGTNTSRLIEILTRFNW